MRTLKEQSAQKKKNQEDFSENAKNFWKNNF